MPLVATGIILEVERGKTTINNMDLLDFWKGHICAHADRRRRGDDARAFYEHHDFQPLPGQPRRLVMKLTTAAKALGVPWP